MFWRGAPATPGGGREFDILTDRRQKRQLDTMTQTLQRDTLAANKLSVPEKPLNQSKL